MSQFVYNSFTEEDIIKAVNAALVLANPTGRIKAVALRGTSGTYDSTIEFSTNTGGKLVAVLWSSDNSNMGIRSVLKIVDPRKGFSHLLNGQSATNTIELVFNGEKALTQTTKAQYEVFVKEMYHAWADDADYEELVKTRVSWAFID